MLITCVHVENFKRIHEIKISPDADRELLVIGGNNANGKTSLLDALRAAFGGKNALPEDPVRHGAESALIVVQLDSGIRITRSIGKDGDSKLEVRDELGAVKSPQAVLDKLVAGGRFLDPLAFLAMKPAEQRTELLRLVDREGKVAALDVHRERVFSRRTEVGRDHKRALAQLEAAPPAAPSEPIDVSALVKQLDEIAQGERARDKAMSRAMHEADDLDRMRTLLAEDYKRLESIKESIRAREAALEPLIESVRVRAEEAKALGAAVDTKVERERIQASIQAAHVHNQRSATAKAAADQRAQLSKLVGDLWTEIDTLTARLADIDAEKSRTLEAAKLPVASLGVSSDGVTLAGVPLAQASAAERLRVALALAIAASPELRDIWVRDAAVLDDESLAAVAEHARASGYRCWVERVGSRDPGAIIIRDGRVASPNGANANQGEMFGEASR